MPTKKETIKFIRENNVPIKAPTSMSVNQVLDAVDKAVEKMPKSVSNKWKKLKLIHDMSPAEKEAQKKRLDRRALAKGVYGTNRGVPKNMARDKKKQAKNIDDEIKNLHAMSDKLEAKKKKSKN